MAATPAKQTVHPPASASASASPPTIADEYAKLGWIGRMVDKLGLDAQRSAFERYGTALAAFSVAALMRLLLDPYLGARVPYGFFLIATAFVAWRCGLVPALITLACSVMFARYRFEDPRGTFSVEEIANHVSFFTSIAIGLITTLFCESLRRAAAYYSTLYKLAREADARKDEFLATLAHELRNPLQPISNALFLMDKIEPKDPRITQLRNMIGSQVEHLVRLVNDLLDVSRITQGKVELRAERIDLRPVIDTALEVVAPLMKEKEHEIHVTYPNELLYLDADRVRLTQILTNLLNNAVKYTDKGGRIWLTVEVEDESVLVRVSDTGIGIAPDMLQQIFDLFQQASHTIAQSQGGLGIGLTLVKKLVEMHGGTVSAESPGLGLGSKFTVRLPLAERRAEPRPAPSRQVNSPAAHTTSLRILVVEDLPAIASSLASLLKHWNHEVEIARDGFTGLEIVRSFRPDVILADLGLPRMSGYQFAEEVRRMPQMDGVVLIAVSGYGQEADRQRSKAVGFSWHFVKPIDLSDLEKVLGELGAAKKACATGA